MNFDDYINRMPYARPSDDRVMWTNYNKEECRICAIFKTDILSRCSLTDHPRADELFNLAWEYGHSGGYGEVTTFLIEMSEALGVI